MSVKTKKLLIMNLPYLIAALVATNFGEAWRLAEGTDFSEKSLSFLSTLGTAFASPLPSFHPFDLLIGILCGGALWLAVYLKGKNAKKYRHGMEYGSARWGTAKDIEPFEDPVFANNVILTRTERLMMGCTHEGMGRKVPGTGKHRDSRDGSCGKPVSGTAGRAAGGGTAYCSGCN